MIIVAGAVISHGHMGGTLYSRTEAGSLLLSNLTALPGMTSDLAECVSTQRGVLPTPTHDSL